MSNSLGGRRRNNQSSASVDAEKIQQLEAELAALKKTYAEDMGNIGIDMIGLNDKIEQLKTN
jgi:predicted  nucleic acid-binding Zn-ribbon protein